LLLFVPILSFVLFYVVIIVIIIVDFVATSCIRDAICFLRLAPRAFSGTAAA
jgi:hypothetical protein